MTPTSAKTTYYKVDYQPWAAQVLNLIQNAENEAKILEQDTIIFQERDVNKIVELIVCMLEEFNASMKEIDQLRGRILRLEAKFSPSRRYSSKDPKPFKF